MELLSDAFLFERAGIDDFFLKLPLRADVTGDSDKQSPTDRSR